MKLLLRKLLKKGVIPWIAAIILWHVASLFTKPDYLPGPIQTLIGAKELLSDGSLFLFVGVSFRRVLTGWVLGTLVSVPLGLVIGRWRLFKEFIEPFLHFFRFIPAISFITLFILWFGIGEQSKIALIMYATAFIVTINTAQGVMAVGEDKIRAARSLGASDIQILFSVIVPAAVPFIFTGIRLAMGNSFMAIVGAEMIAAKEGVGYLIWNSRMYFKTDWMFVGLLSLGLMGFTADGLLRFIGSKWMKRYGVMYETNFGGR